MPQEINRQNDRSVGGDSDETGGSNASEVTVLVATDPVPQSGDSQSGYAGSSSNQSDGTDGTTRSLRTNEPTQGGEEANENTPLLTNASRPSTSLWELLGRFRPGNSEAAQSAQVPSQPTGNLQSTDQPATEEESLALWALRSVTVDLPPPMKVIGGLCLMVTAGAVTFAVIQSRDWADSHNGTELSRPTESFNGASRTWKTFGGQ